VVALVTQTQHRARIVPQPSGERLLGVITKVAGAKILG
jgi:hypothetical protein